MLSKDSYKLDKKVNNVRSARSLKKITTRSKFHGSLNVFCMYFHSLIRILRIQRESLFYLWSAVCHCGNTWSSTLCV